MARFDHRRAARATALMALGFAVMLGAMMGLAALAKYSALLCCTALAVAFLALVYRLAG